MGDHEPDLLVVHGVLIGDRLGEEEDSEDVAAVAAKRGARFVVVFRFFEQKLDRRLFEVARALRAKLVCSRVEKVDPLRGHLPRIRRRRV